MRDPYRVIVWGPGGVGKAALKLLYGRPEFELVGVLCHTMYKHGVDAGSYIGKDEWGVYLSWDRDAVLGMDADVVLYTGQPAMDREQADRDVMDILRSGKNVISITAYHYPHYHGEAYATQLEEACRAGNASLHGTGEMPGIFLDRIVPTLTGLTQEVEHVHVEEWYNTSQSAFRDLEFLGVNRTLAEAQAAAGMIGGILNGGYAEALALVTKVLWDEPAPQIGFAAEFETADADIELPFGTVRAGHVAERRFTFTAAIDGTPRLTVALNWTLSERERWIVEIEGDPISTRTEIDGYASLADGGIVRRPGDTTFVGQYATAIPVVQAIPLVVEAPPGIVYPTVFINATPDLRRLATRATVAG